MARKKTTSWQDVDARYWRAVKTQDEFRRETFVNFVKPLSGLYKDPPSAGAHILSYYLSNPLDMERAFKSDPTTFGSLSFGAVSPHAQEIYADLLLGRHGPPLAKCAGEFENARKASLDLEALAAEHPSIYQDLQKERTLRRSDGKSVYVDKPQGARRTRKYKIHLRPKTE